MKNVKFTANVGLCCSCGLCKNICPKRAINYIRSGGMYLPVVDSCKCVSCGLCTKVCPGLGTDYPNEDGLNAVYGTYKALYNAWSRNAEIRHISASGGVVSTLVQELLRQKYYDVAFCVDTYAYQEQLKTHPITIESLDCGIEQTFFPKSRYLPVSHEDAVSFIKANPNKKVIFIGTSCAIQGLRKVLNLLKRDDKQFLLIGLFCDKVLNYNVYQYFENTFAEGRSLGGIHFKNKESGGWPGNMKFLFKDGNHCFVDKTERGNAKDYFMPERCLYCIDKLNVNADISLGDNYTIQNSSPLGSNTVFIRTEQGMAAWQVVAPYLEYQEVDSKEVRSAQYLDGRLNNLMFAKLKEEQIKKKYKAEVVLNAGIITGEKFKDYERAWKRCLAKSHSGEVYLDNPKELMHQKILEKQYHNAKHPRVLAERIYYAIKRCMR